MQMKHFKVEWCSCEGVLLSSLLKLRAKNYHD